RVEAEQRDQRVALDLLGLAALGVLDRDGADAAVAVDRAHLEGREDLDAPLTFQLSRLVDRRLQRAEVVAPVHQRNWVLRRVLYPERPVERAVAAADDHASAVPEDVLLAHEVVEALPLPGVDVIDPELPRLEGPVTRGDDQRSAQVRTALVGRDREHLLAVLAQPLQALDLLAEQNLGAVLRALLRPRLYQRLTLDLGVAGDVVDVLLGIDSRDLPAELLEAFDDPHRGIAMACVIRGRQARWAGAEDRDVGDVAHGPMLDAVAG